MTVASNQLVSVTAADDYRCTGRTFHYGVHVEHAISSTVSKSLFVLRWNFFRLITQTHWFINLTGLNRVCLFVCLFRHYLPIFFLRIYIDKCDCCHSVGSKPVFFRGRFDAWKNNSQTTAMMMSTSVHWMSVRNGSSSSRIIILSRLSISRSRHSSAMVRVWR